LPTLILLTLPPPPLSLPFPVLLGYPLIWGAPLFQLVQTKSTLFFFFFFFPNPLESTGCSPRNSHCLFGFSKKKVLSITPPPPPLASKRCLFVTPALRMDVAYGIWDSLPFFKPPPNFSAGSYSHPLKGLRGSLSTLSVFFLFLVVEPPLFVYWQTLFFPPPRGPFPS